MRITRISTEKGGIDLTVRSADSHVRSTPRGSVYVVLTIRAQRASLGSCLVKRVSDAPAPIWWYHPNPILYIVDWESTAGEILGDIVINIPMVPAR